MKCVVDPAGEARAYEEAVDGVSKDLVRSGVPWSFSRSVAGAFVGNLIDQATNDEDGGDIPIFTIIGGLAGAPMVRTAVRNASDVVKGAKASGAAHDAFQSIKKTGQISDEAYKTLANFYNMKEADLRKMTATNKEVFYLDNQKAVASAVLMDRMVGNMAKRAGITKDAMYAKIDFTKTDLAHVPKEAKLQLDSFSLLSKADQIRKGTPINLSAHALLAAPGALMTGTVGMDENGEFTLFGKLMLAAGVLGFGGVLLRSMTPKFKLRVAYDSAPAKVRETFDTFDFRKITDIREITTKEGKRLGDEFYVRTEGRNLTQEEMGMINWFKKQGVPDDDFLLLAKLTTDNIRRYPGSERMEYFAAGEVEKANVSLSKRDILPDMKVEQMTSSSYGEYSSLVGSDENVYARRPYPTDKMNYEMIYLLEDFEKGLTVRTQEGAPPLERRYEPIPISPRNSHEFQEFEKVPESALNAGYRPKEVRPLSWARLQRKGERNEILYIDELQVDNEIQIRGSAVYGDQILNDIYSVVMDDVMKYAKDNGIEKIYMTSGQLQAVRYHGTVIKKPTEADVLIGKEMTRWSSRLKNFVLNEEDDLVNFLRQIYMKENPEKLYDLENMLNSKEETEKLLGEIDDKLRAEKAKQIELQNELQEQISDYLSKTDARSWAYYDDVVRDLKATYDWNSYSTLKELYQRAAQNGKGKINADELPPFFETYKNKIEDNSRVRNDLHNKANLAYKNIENSEKRLIEAYVNEFNKNFNVLYDFDQIKNFRVHSKRPGSGLYQFYDNTLPSLMKKRYGAETIQARDYVAEIGEIKNDYFAPVPFEYAFHEIKVPDWKRVDEAYGKATKRLFYEDLGKGAKKLNAMGNPEGIKFQKDAVAARGAAMVNLDGSAVIYALTDPNVSTPLHEMSHVFEHYMTEAEKNVFLKAAGKKTWDLDVSEQFARGFEKYLADGMAPTSELQSIFNSFKNWLMDIYNSITGSAIDVKINKEMRAVYDRMIETDPSLAASQPRRDMPKEMLDAAEVDKMGRAHAEDVALGYSGDPRNTAQVGEFRQMVSAVNNALRTGRNAFDTVLQSRYTESAFSMLRRLAPNSPHAKRFKDVLSDLPNQIKQMRAMPVTYFNSRYGSQAYDNFYATGEEMYSQVLKNIGVDTNFGKQEITQEFNDAVYRILHSGLGGKNPQTRKNLQEFYSANPTRLQADREMMQDPMFRDFIEAHREGLFSTVNRKAQQVMEDQITRDMVDLRYWEESLTPERQMEFASVMRVMDDFVENGGKLTWKQYGESIKESPLLGDYQITKKYMRNDDFKNETGRILVNRIRGLRSRMAEMEKLDKAYMPQKESQVKVRRQLENYLRNNPGKTEQDFELYKMGRYAELNAKGKGELMDFDEELLDYNTKFYGSVLDAEAEFDRIVRLYEATFTDEQLQYIRANRNRYISKVSRQVLTKKGEPLRKGGKPVFRTEVYLRNPDDAPFDVFAAKNKDTFEKYYRAYTVDYGVDVKKANHIDYKRSMDIPHEFVESDMQELTRFYAGDVAPRLHMMNNEMFTAFDVEQKYLTPIRAAIEKQYRGNPAVIKDMSDRLIDVYNAALRVQKFEGLADMERHMKRSRFVNAWRNIQATAYQYGIGFYNWFEHAVQTPLITSWDAYGNTMRTFAFDRDAANAWGDYVVERRVIDNQLRTHGAQYENFDDSRVIGGSGLPYLERKLEQAAQFSSTFSFSKSLGNMIGVDVEKSGLYRVFFDGFIGGNIMSTAVMSRSALSDVLRLAKAHKALEQLPEGAPKVVMLDGVRYNVGEIRRRLDLHGINERNMDYFLLDDTQTFINETIGTLDAGKRLTPEQIATNARALEIMDTVINRSTESFHATNTMFRPEFMTTPFGRLLSQYSSYPFNLAMQNIQQRIRFPINEWRGKYGNFKNTTLGTIMWHYSKGNFDELYKLGLSKQAIEEFPAEAINHVMKYFVGAFGISVAGAMSIDALRDLISYPFADDEEEEFLRLKRRMVLNPLSPKSEQRTFDDLINDYGHSDMLKLVQYMAGLHIDTGMAGRFDILYSPNFQRKNVVELFPLGREAQMLYNDAQSIMGGGLEDFSSTTSSAVARIVLSKTPIIGSSLFSDTRKGMLKAMQGEDTTFSTADGYDFDLDFYQAPKFNEIK